MIRLNTNEQIEYAPLRYNGMPCGRRFLGLTTAVEIHVDTEPESRQVAEVFQRFVREMMELGATVNGHDVTEIDSAPRPHPDCGACGGTGKVRDAERGELVCLRCDPEAATRRRYGVWNV